MMPQYKPKDDHWISRLKAIEGLPDEEDGPPCEECGEYDCDCFQCPTCKGGGTVNPLTAPSDFFCVGTDDCPTCDGSGEV